MSTIHFHQTTSSTPEQFIAGLSDFGPGRSELFGNSADGYLEVHDRGPDSADVTGQVIEASGLVLAIAEGWHRGPSTQPAATPAEVGPRVRELLPLARPRTLFHEVS